MYTVQCTVYSVQCTVYSVTVYIVQCTVYSVQCYSIHCTLYTVHRTALHCTALHLIEIYFSLRFTIANTLSFLVACLVYCTFELYCTVLYYTILYCTVPYCTVLYYTVLYCTVLYTTLQVGTCFTAMDSFSRFSEYSPCRTGTGYFTTVMYLQNRYWLLHYCNVPAEKRTGNSTRKLNFTPFYSPLYN